MFGVQPLIKDPSVINQSAGLPPAFHLQPALIKTHSQGFDIEVDEVDG